MRMHTPCMILVEPTHYCLSRRWPWVCKSGKWRASTERSRGDCSTFRMNLKWEFSWLLDIQAILTYCPNLSKQKSWRHVSVTSNKNLCAIQSFDYDSFDLIDNHDKGRVDTG